MTTIRISLVVVIAVVVVVAAAVFTTRTTATATIREADSFEAALMFQMNATRRAHGLPPLRRAQGLAAAASAKSHEMARLGYFAHTTPSGTPFWRQVLIHYKRIGSGYWRTGENLAWGVPTTKPATVVKRWLASPPHRANLLSRRYEQFGVGAVLATNATGFWTARGDVVVIAAEFAVRR